MFKEISQLPQQYKSMIYLVALSDAGIVLSGIFINIYAYQLNNDFFTVLLYNVGFFSSIMVGFVFLGFIFGKYNWSIKKMYFISYVFYILGVCIINFYSFEYGVLLYSIFYGIGVGAFRCANHAQELACVEDKQRDNYISLLSSFGVFIKIITPLFIALLFIIAQYLPISGYTLLFSLFPCIYLISFIFIKHIPDYWPKAIKKSDFIHFKKYHFAGSYFITGSIYHAINFSIIPMISFYMLHNEITIGFYETAASTLSILTILLVKKYRHSENRKNFLFFISSLIFCNYVLFITHFDLSGYIVFTLFHLFLWPLYTISKHTYDLTLMDNLKAPRRDFYAPMIFREIFLWIGRTIGVILLYFLYKILDTMSSIMQVGLIFIPIFVFLSVISIYFYHKYEDKNI